MCAAIRLGSGLQKPMRLERESPLHKCAAGPRCPNTSQAPKHPSCVLWAASCPAPAPQPTQTPLSTASSQHTEDLRTCCSSTAIAARPRAPPGHPKMPRGSPVPVEQPPEGSPVLTAAQDLMPKHNSAFKHKCAAWQSHRARSKPQTGAKKEGTFQSSSAEPCDPRSRGMWGCCHGPQRTQGPPCSPCSPFATCTALPRRL